MKFIKCTAIVGALFILSGQSSSPTKFCRSAGGIEGMATEHDRAQMYVGSKTRDRNEIKIYVSRFNSSFFYQSNFISEGYDVTTKLSNRNPLDLLNATFFAIEPNAEAVMQTLSRSDVSQLDSFAKERARFVVDETIFDSRGYSSIDFWGYENLSVATAPRLGNHTIGGSRTNGLEIDPIDILAKHSPLTEAMPRPFKRLNLVGSKRNGLMGRLAGCCLFGIPPIRLEQMRSALGRLSFKRDNFQLLNLSRNTRTLEKLYKDPVLSTHVLRSSAEGGEYSSREQVLQKLRESSGKQLAILGHVKDGQFQIREADRTEVFSISLRELTEVAKESNVVLMLIGCKTAESINENLSGFGVVEAFNSLNAVEALAKAIGQSHTQLELLENLSSEQFNLVVDQNFVRSNQRVWAAAVYSRTSPGGKRRRVGDVILILPSSNPAVEDDSEAA